jgi:hypothetical protein
LEAAVVGPAGVGTAQLLRVAALSAAPGLVLASWTGGENDGGGSSGPESAVPLLAGRTGEGMPRAYVCRGMVCRRQVSTAEELLAELAAQPGSYT